MLTLPFLPLILSYLYFYIFVMNVITLLKFKQISTFQKILTFSLLITEGLNRKKFLESRAGSIFPNSKPSEIKFPLRIEKLFLFQIGTYPNSLSCKLSQHIKPTPMSLLQGCIYFSLVFSFLYNPIFLSVPLPRIIAQSFPPGLVYLTIYHYLQWQFNQLPISSINNNLWIQEKLQKKSNLVTNRLSIFRNLRISIRRNWNCLQISKVYKMRSFYNHLPLQCIPLFAIL